MAFGLPARAAAEIDLDALIAAAPASGDIPLISGFPVAKEDVALIVDHDVPAAAVERALRTGADHCWSRCGCSMSTPARRSVRGRSRWRTPSGSGLRTVLHRRRSGRRARRCGWHGRRAYGAVQRTV